MNSRPTTIPSGRQAEDFWLVGAHSLPSGTVTVGTDLVSLGEMRRRSYYHEVHRGLDLEYLIGGIIENRPGRLAYISVLRGRSSENFSDQSRRTMGLLIPHLQKAYFIHRQFLELHTAKSSFEQVLDQSPYGVVVVAGSRRTLLVNRKADRILSAQDGISFRHGRIRLSNRDLQARLDNQLGHACNAELQAFSSKGSQMRIDRPSGRLPYQLVVTPISLSPGRTFDHPEGVSAIFIHDPADTPKIDRGMLQTAYRLTAAEARVCELLFSLSSLDEVMDSLNISRNTAKTHLRHIFDKCGVNSQAELLRTLALGLKSEP